MSRPRAGSSRRSPHPELYRQRNVSGGCFKHVKHFHRLATRFDRLARYGLSTIAVVAIRLWSRFEFGAGKNARGDPCRLIVTRRVTCAMLAAARRMHPAEGCLGVVEEISHVLASDCAVGGGAAGGRVLEFCGGSRGVLPLCRCAGGMRRAARRRAAPGAGPGGSRGAWCWRARRRRGAGRGSSWAWRGAWDTHESRWPRRSRWAPLRQTPFVRIESWIRLPA